LIRGHSYGNLIDSKLITIENNSLSDTTSNKFKGDFKGMSLKEVAKFYGAKHCQSEFQMEGYKIPNLLV
jgi:hypothetical protein